MKEFLTSEYEALTQTLLRILVEAENNLQAAGQSYEAIDASLKRIQEFMQPHQFADEQEQILYYKHLKPMFLSEYIYFGELYQIEMHFPVGDQQAQKGYIAQVFAAINIFFEQNGYLHNYYRSKRTNLDHFIFLYDSPSVLPLPEIFFDIDRKITTPNSYKLAKIQAFERLSGYLNNLLDEIEHGKKTGGSNTELRGPIHSWTDSKVGLVELAYALFCQGAIDNGKAELKDIVSMLEQTFGVNLGNFYAVFQQNIRLRKKNRTVFMDACRANLEKYMDDLDAHPARI